MPARGRGAALSLYRAILKAHKGYLPAEMRSLGNAYVKSEFKLHKNVENTSQLDSFVTAWEEYLNQMHQTARIKESSLSLGEKEMTASFGKHLSPDIELSEEQAMQLEKLKEEATKAGR